MCGIAGLVNPQGSQEERASAVARMCAAMPHRGPDDHGMANVSVATLGMRRLAIFDPKNGRQPMQSPDGRLTLVFNGAIYNFRELRPELARQGWAFRTECDTEVLLAGLALWGEACLDRLRGMFAFAAWDERDQSLLLARDPFGIKPLYYRHEGERLLFASEVGALTASRMFAADVDPHAVGDYLSWLAVPAPRTIYRDVFALRPGECATFARGQLSIRAAWDFRGGASAQRCPGHAEFTRELRTRLEDTIRAHVVADVPVGAFLSGGLDSAAIVALMSRTTAGPLRTFSIGFDEAGYSEATEAEANARHLGTQHDARVLTGRQVGQDIETLLAAMDQPTGDGINTYYASQLARAGGVKVALSGLGGDELFGGYPAFHDVPRLARWLPVWRAVPGPLRRGFVARLGRGDTRQRKLADFLQHARNLPELAALQRRVFSDHARRPLLRPEVAQALETQSPFHPELAALREELAGAPPFHVISAWEMRTYMADVLLRDSDVMSMAHSLELRVPFIDRRFVEWLRQQAPEFLDTPNQPKSALAEATSDLLPPALLTRRKRGFTLPFALWMKRELRPFLDETFSTASVARTGFFEPAAVAQVWDRYLQADDAREWSRVWSLAVLIAFVNRGARA